MTGATAADFFEEYTNTGAGGTALAVQDMDGNLVRGFYYSGDALKDLSEKLRQCCEWLYNFHAALRSELCGGS